MHNVQQRQHVKKYHIIFFVTVYVFLMCLIIFQMKTHFRISTPLSRSKCVILKPPIQCLSGFHGHQEDKCGGQKYGKFCNRKYENRQFRDVYSQYRVTKCHKGI